MKKTLFSCKKQATLCHNRSHIKGVLFFQRELNDLRKDMTEEDNALKRSMTALTGSMTEKNNALTRSMTEKDNTLMRSMTEENNALIRRMTEKENALRAELKVGQLLLKMSCFSRSTYLIFYPTLRYLT